MKIHVDLIDTSAASPRLVASAVFGARDDAKGRELVQAAKRAVGLRASAKGRVSAYAGQTLVKFPHGAEMELRLRRA